MQAQPDPFTLLGLPARFDLDPAPIEQAYLARAAAVHPDLAGDDPTRAAQAAREAAALNDAKATLLDPEARARALLSLLAAGDASPGGRDLPDGFLMEIMQTRMELESAVAEGDAEAIARWREWAAAERRSYIDRIGALFAGLSQPPNEPDLSTIGRRLNAWRYIERLIEQLPD